MKTLLRAAAIAVASTALVAGATTSATAAAGDGAAASVAPQNAYTSGFRASTTSLVPTAITPTVPGIEISSLRATVLVNGAPVANDVFVSPQSGFTYQRAWGIGVVSLTNIVAQGYDSRTGTRTFFSGKPIAPSAGAQIRYGIEFRSGLEVKKRGKKLTFKVKARYVDNAGRNVGIRKATIQVKKGSKWRTLKKLTLKKNGTKTYTRRDGKKRNYRLVITETSVYQGGQTKPLRKL
ncbi:hypothetical protein [Aeromicrobium fastidiosum]|uniref:Uncharacterized protein n=1 Tax=Aeromicrobium fastidiosum TaxID=52699 RepID=A0A641APK8_9ACTN|nr:hypothetical protein [Aeromicrobium fastidiosum]KAA1380034.1 hypothetical protein ESP62_002180 [Aeromicrobium fastidiosum]MBP2389559.1 putative secreted protein [Aeromicrobium fastidiosum]